MSGTETGVPAGSRLTLAVSFTSHVVSCVAVSHLCALWSKWHLVSKLRHTRATDDCDYVPLRAVFRVRILEPKGGLGAPMVRPLTHGAILVPSPMATSLCLSTSGDRGAGGCRHSTGSQGPHRHNLIFRKGLLSVEPKSEFK